MEGVAIKTPDTQELADKIKHLIDNGRHNPAEIISLVRGLYLTEVDNELSNLDARQRVLVDLKDELHK